MPAANVQLVMHHVRAGNELGDDLEAVAGIHTCIARDLLLADENVPARRIGVQVFRRSGHRDLFLRGGNGELVMKHRRRTGNHNQHLRLRCKSRSINGNGVLAERYRVEVELAIGAGVGRQLVGRIAGLQRGVRSFDRLVLRIVDDAADVAENSGRSGRTEKGCPADDEEANRPELQRACPVRKRST